MFLKFEFVFFEEAKINVHCIMIVRDNLKKTKSNKSLTTFYEGQKLCTKSLHLNACKFSKYQFSCTLRLECSLNRYLKWF